MLHNLEELGMSQYGILKSLNFINISFPEIRVGDPYQRFKNIYFHFGLIFDSINNFCRNLCIIKEILERKNLIRTPKQSETELLNGFQKWITKKYDKSYDKTIRLWKPMLYYPHSDINYLKILEVPNPLRRNYNSYVTSIKNYRNFYIHTPGVDIITSYGRLRAIKNEHLNEYRLWSKIKKCLDQNPNHDHFSDPKEIVENDLNETLDHCNSIWEHLIKHMDEISKHPRYKEISSHYNREN